MAMPKDFGFGEDAQMLRDAARKFLRENLPIDRLHRLVAGDPDPARAPAAAWDRALWAQMVELGWTQLAVPERAGGMGMPRVAVAALAEEGGRAALPSPLLATLLATALLDACATPAADGALGEIANGTPATLALTGRRGAWEGGTADVELRDGALHGTAWYVQDAGKSALLLVKAATGNDAAGLFLVDANAPGVRIVADAIVDLTRDQAHIEFAGVQPRAVLSDDAAGAIAGAEPVLLTLLAADMCGAGEWLLQTTAEYARVRRQFDHPIGFFQAVKHPLVDLMIQIDLARSHVYNAACALDHDPANAAKWARMAKSAAGDMAIFGASRALQFHGGIGFTWECYVHLYFKRQMHSQALYGDAAYHRERLAELLIG